MAQRFQDGDADAVRDVYREYGRLVYAVAHKVLGDRSLAEDATQQAFVQAWKAAATYDPNRELGPWLATIARRAAIDVHRRESRRASRADRRRGARPTRPSSPCRPRPSRPTTSGRCAGRSSALPDDERDVVRLQHLEGLTHAEVAEQPRRARRYREIAVVPSPQAPGRAGSATCGRTDREPSPTAAVDTWRKVNNDY